MSYLIHMFGWMPESLYKYVSLAIAIFIIALLFKIIKLILDAIPFV